MDLFNAFKYQNVSTFLSWYLISGSDVPCLIRITVEILHDDLLCIILVESTSSKTAASFEGNFLEARNKTLESPFHLQETIPPVHLAGSLPRAAP